MGPFSPPDVVLAALLLGACWTDWREGKIKNILTFPVMITGLLMAPLFAEHAYDGVLGLLAAFVVSVGLWRFGNALKPGDVKLFMAAGTLVGPETILRAVLLTLVLNLPIGFVILAVRGRLGHFYRFWVKGERDQKTEMIFALVIAAGVTLARVQPWPNLWGPK